MLPTFVIGLREGVEASLIVGIVAAFLNQQGRRDALRTMWIGVVIAVLLCLGIGIVLQIINENLPQKEQEGLETVVAGVAVIMVTYMIVFMRKHAKSLRGELEERAKAALADGSTSALVLMAFLAVMREGLETAVFLLAQFQSSRSKVSSVGGAVLGLVVAVFIGTALYRGGRKINLAKFFTVTGAVLVVVAAGLVSFGMHTAHEAGWINSWQGEAMNLSGFVKPGSIRSALVTGVLGIQPRPTWAETVAWLVYLVPVMTFVLWPRRRSAHGSGAKPVATTADHAVPQSSPA
ncbi:MAG: putative transrane protein [Ilumatobacteraceae bacterium]|nr:putative transrane protein [Ilumatobacteraceae bacterium]